MCLQWSAGGRSAGFLFTVMKSGLNEHVPLMASSWETLLNLLANFTFIFCPPKAIKAFLITCYSGKLYFRGEVEEMCRWDERASVSERTKQACSLNCYNILNISPLGHTANDMTAGKLISSTIFVTTSVYNDKNASTNNNSSHLLPFPVPRISCHRLTFYGHISNLVNWFVRAQIK